MIRREQTTIHDAMAEAEQRLSMPRSVQARLSYGIVTGIGAVLGKELSATSGDSNTPAPEVDLLDLYGKFWNAAQVQSVDKKPRAIRFSDDEITYISGLSSSARDLTDSEREALSNFKKEVDKTVWQQPETEQRQRKKEGKGMKSAWWDLRW